MGPGSRRDDDLPRMGENHPMPRFQKGQSGNPSGRPKSRGLVASIRRATGDGKELVDLSLKIMRDPKSSNAEKQRAVDFLADRGWGKATQIIEADVTAQTHHSGPQVLDVETLPTEKLLRLFRVVRDIRDAVPATVVEGEVVATL